ncbi:unnamed protein product [Meloidogyne enterolobii]|uniref:Uncharacterized protein n=1 Tax=Meloidogyne enterolobii TaxID=390850 RepID=A0ACB1A4X8_MELEN
MWEKCSSHFYIFLFSSRLFSVTLLFFKNFLFFFFSLKKHFHFFLSNLHT